MNRKALLRNLSTRLGMASLALLTLQATTAYATTFVGDLVYCDVAGDSGVYEPGLGDYGIDGVGVTVECASTLSGESCGTWTATSGSLDNLPASIQTYFFDATRTNSCAESTTFGPSELGGRYLVNPWSTPNASAGTGCFGVEGVECVVTLDPATVPADCNSYVTPLVDPVTPAGDVPADGNDDGDFCDPEDGPFAEGQILGNNSASQPSCERSPSPGPPSTGVHVANKQSWNTRCALYNDFGFTPGGECELEVETLCRVTDPAGLAPSSDCTIASSAHHSGKKKKSKKKSGKKKGKKKKGKKKSGKKKSSHGSQASGDNQVEYTYIITNTGTQSAFDVVAIDDVYGELPNSPIAEIAAGESVTFSQMVEVTQSISNTLYASAAGENGTICEGEGSATVTVKPQPPSKKKKKKKGKKKGKKKKKKKKKGKKKKGKKKKK